jgi:hypothetical protein
MAAETRRSGRLGERGLLSSKRMTINLYFVVPYFLGGQSMIAAWAEFALPTDCAP